MQRLRYLLIGLLFIGIRHFSFCQGDELFSPFFAEKNLSSLNITCFFQDNSGHMWIGTYDGLNLFNGKTIRSFKHDRQNSKSLVDNLIMTICQDKDGSVWIGTSRGISKFNAATLDFVNYSVDNKNQALGYKLSVFADRDNTIWACSGAELFQLNRSTNTFERFHPNFKSNKIVQSPSLYTGIFQDSKNRHWITSNNGIYRFFPKDTALEPFVYSPNNPYFYPLAEAPNGELYCGTWGFGLFHLNTALGQLDTLEKTGQHITYAFQTNKDHTTLWYGTVLSRLDLNSLQKKKFKHDYTTHYSVKNNGISALYVDQQNQLWIGYETKGIQIASPSNQIFRAIKMPEDNTFATVNCYFKTQTYNYIGGWHSNSLARLDSAYRPVKIWKTLIPKTTKTGNNISDAWIDPTGSIWLSSSYGLIQVNEKNDSTHLYKLDTSITKRSHFLQIISEGDSVLWLSGYFCGLSRFSLRTKTFQNWGAKQRSLYWGIARDREGIIWLADDSGQLTGYDPKTKRFISKDFSSFTERSTYNSILYDSVDNVIWVGTTNGLLKINRNDFSAKIYTEKDHLPTNQINSIQLDRRHRLWIATNNGLCLFDQRQNAFKTFLSGNGLPDNVLSQLFKIDKADELFIGQENGFSILQTSAVPIELVAKNVTIDYVFESGNSIQIQSQKKSKTVALSYDQNNVSIEFSSSDLVNSEDNQLLYRLDGFETQWHSASTGVVNYSKLAPGTYVFHVTCINHAGLKPRADDYLTLVINPPFWKTTWFILSSSIVLILLILAIARYIFTRNLREKILILEKEKALEKERNRISQDMHDELGSGLTKISILSEVAMAQLEAPEKTIDQLKNISNSSRALVDTLQDIIWILNSKNETLDNLCAYIREYTFKYFEASDIKIKVHFPEKIEARALLDDQRRSTLMVFKEAFHNITKHSHCTQIEMRLEITAHYAKFILIDNGIGFDQANVRQFANGLNNMKKRMSSIGGDFAISSKLKEGARTEFGFPL